MKQDHRSKFPLRGTGGRIGGRTGGHLISEMNSVSTNENMFHLWWLGQSGFLLQWKNNRVLIDPYLSDSLTKKYAATDKPHIRMSELVVDPSLLENISIITSSHNHTDHLDAETILPVLKNNPGISLLIPEANRAFVAERLNCNPDFPVGITDGQSVSIGEFTFHGIPAKHNEISRDNNGNSHYMGYIISFCDFHVYHSGDTLLFDELPSLLKPFKLDVVLLPINGNDPARGVAGNLNFREAVDLALDVHAETVVPCHYDLFTFNTANVNDFIEYARHAGQPFHVLKGGERLTVKNKTNPS
jgi:L-ascorbate metabolism protein UlaG (beta-lactamase superfamily)